MGGDDQVRGDRLMMAINITVTEAGRAWSSGTALVDDKETRWEAYRKDASSIRVMLAQDGKWIDPHTMSAARLAISPIARRAMKG
jgi:hypothetical protein